MEYLSKYHVVHHGSRKELSGTEHGDRYNRGWRLKTPSPAENAKLISFTKHSELTLFS